MTERPGDTRRWRELALMLAKCPTLLVLSLSELKAAADELEPLLRAHFARRFRQIDAEMTGEQIANRIEIMDLGGRQ
jgi:inorganic triphosphatase YgiF